MRESRDADRERESRPPGLRLRFDCDRFDRSSRIDLERLRVASRRGDFDPARESARFGVRERLGLLLLRFGERE